ncbi:MAG: nucleotidyltransferase family protein [Pseudomonadota bacterium]
MAFDVSSLTLPPTATIGEAMQRIDQFARQLVLVVDADGRLIATVTDGDIRRGLLAGQTMASPVGTVMRTNPSTISAGTGSAIIRRIMRERSLNQVPVVDPDGRVVDLAWIGDHVGHTSIDTRVVIMAGGLGTRLRPLTETVAKPMLKVGDHPLLEITIQSLIEQGFGRFTLSVNYLAETIRSHFGDGSSWDVEIDYVDETEPMGTAGALPLLKDWPNEPFIVMNGDILTKLRFDRLLQHQMDTGALATMGVREYSVQVPYGVVRTNGNRLTGIEEKPTESWFVNSGIYVLSPEIRPLIELGRPLDMPELFQSVVDSGRLASVFPIRDYWIDIGRVEDLERARADFSSLFDP